MLSVLRIFGLCVVCSSCFIIDCIQWVWLDDQGEERIKELKDQMHQLEEENEGLKRDMKKMQNDIETLEGTNEGGEEFIQNGFLLPPSLFCPLTLCNF